MPRDMKQFGKRVQKKRRECHLSQNEAAESLGISPNHLSTLETGNCQPSYKVLCDLCELLDTTPNYLIMGSLHSNNLSQNVIDKIHLLSERQQLLVFKIIDLLLEDESL